MKDHSDESDADSSPASSTPLLNQSNMAAEQELLYTSGSSDSPIQQKNKLGLHVDIEAANRLAETRLQKQLAKQTETEPQQANDDVEVDIQPGDSSPVCSYCSGMSLVIYCLVILFGSGSWIAINGVWVELPLLVPRLPEGWDLPSYLSVTIQLANVGPLIFFIAFTLYPTKVKEKPVVFAITLLGATACFLLGFFWSHTTFIAGVNHSTALLVLTFLLAFVDCTSSVVFLPFMALFPEEYMTAFYIGEGFSGLLPSLVSLGQGAGEYECVNTSVLVNETINGTIKEVTEWKIVPVLQEPNFPVEDFYFFLFVMMTVCGIAFVLLNYLPHCKKFHLTNGNSKKNSPKIPPKLKNGEFQRTDSERKPKVGFNEQAEIKPLAPNIPPQSHALPKQMDTSALTEQTTLSSPDVDSQQAKARMRHRSSPGTMTAGLPDVADGDDSVFGGPASATSRRRFQSAVMLARQASYKPSRRRLASFGPMDLNFSRPDLHPLPEELEPIETPLTAPPTAKSEEGQLTRKDYIYLLFLITIINALSNGVLPSTQTYSALPYGSLIFSLVVRLSNVMNPLACFLAFFLPTKNYKVLGLITFTALCFAAFTLTLAGMSPHPIMYDSVGGGVLAVIAWLSVVGLFSYAKVLIAMILRDDGRNGLLWCGALTQVGSTVGAVVTFILVNVLQLFNSASHCGS